MEWQKFKGKVREFFAHPVETISFPIPSISERADGDAVLAEQLRRKRAQLSEEIHDRGYGVRWVAEPGIGRLKELPQALLITVEDKKPFMTLLRLRRKELVVTTRSTPTKVIAQLRFHEAGYDECDDDVSNYMVLEVFEKERSKEMEMLAELLEKRHVFTVEVMAYDNPPHPLLLISLLRYWPELGNPAAKEPARFEEYGWTMTQEAISTYSAASALSPSRNVGDSLPGRI